MAKMVVLKRLRYPRGRDGRDYVPGDELETVSDRDTKALTLIRVAKVVAPQETPTLPRRGRPPKSSYLTGSWNSEPKTEETSRQYMRRDMVAED